jgi:hypothetical protein
VIVSPEGGSETLPYFATLAGRRDFHTRAISKITSGPKIHTTCIGKIFRAAA